MKSGISVLLLINFICGLGLSTLWIDETGQLRSNLWIPPDPIWPEIVAPNLSPLADPQAGNIAAYPLLLERPLFAADRRPPPPPSPPPPPDPLRNVQIIGIVTGEKGYILAQIDGRNTRLAQGDMIGEWKLDKFEGRDVIFMQSGGQERKIRMQYARFSPKPRSATSPNTSLSETPSTPSATANTGQSQSFEDRRRAELQRINEFRTANGLAPIQ